MADTLSLVDREAGPATGGPPAPGIAKPERAPTALLAVLAATMTALLLLPAPTGPSTPFSPVWAAIFAVLVGTGVGHHYARRVRGMPADSVRVSVGDLGGFFAPFREIRSGKREPLP